MLAALARAREHHLVQHAAAVVRQVVRLGKQRAQVVGVEHGVLGGRAQPLEAHRAQVGVGAHQHAVWTVELL